MKRILLFVGLSVLLLGCEKYDSTEEVINLEPSEQVDEYGLKLLSDMERLYIDGNYAAVVTDIKYEFEVFKDDRDEHIKEQLITIANDAALGMLDSVSLAELSEVFLPPETVGKNAIEIYEYVTTDSINLSDYLNLDVKEQLVGRLNSTYLTLKEQNLDMVIMEEYINENYQRRNFGYSGYYTDNYEFVGEGFFTDFIIMVDEKVVIEFKDDYFKSVLNAFKVVDEGGNVLNPLEPMLVEYNKRRPFKEKEKKENESFAEQKVKELREEEKKRLKIAEVKLFMTKEEVKERRGEPRRINRTTTINGVREQWVYATMYIYFEDGVVVAIQD